MIRYILIFLLLLISLLSVFRAPAFPLLLVSIIVKELPWVFAGIATLVLLWGWKAEQYPWAVRVAGIVSIILFLSPVLRAYRVARGLEGEIQRAFDGKMEKPKDGAEEKRTGKGDNGRPTETGRSEKAGEAVFAGSEWPFRWWKMLTGIGASKSKIEFRVLTYATAEGAPLTLDFYPAQRRHKRPCIIVVHGGSWSSGDSRQLPDLNSRLAKEGYHVAAVNYRLAPRYRHPAPVEDVRAVLGYLRQNADKFSIDTGAFILLGRSAGAQIALLAAYTLQDPGLKGVISYYGPADMVWGYSVPSNPLIMDSRKVMSDYLGGPYEAVPQNYISSSPIEFVTRRSVPTLLIHGQQDVLVAYEHSVRLDKKLADSGVKHFLLTLPWATHGFDYSLNGPGGQLSTYCVEKFLWEILP
jgi:acetyl esterase/lipase